MVADKWINEGSDKRFDLFGIVSWLQRNLSIVTVREPKWSIRNVRLFTYWTGPREYVAYGIYLKPRPYVIKQTVKQDGRIEPVEVSHEHPDGLEWIPGKVTLYRFGWRVDANMTKPGPDGRLQYTYIFGAAAKTSEDWPMEKGY